MGTIFRGSSVFVNSPSASTTMSPVVPTSVIAGDLILVFCFSGFVTITFSATGYTAVTALSSAPSFSSQTLWKTAVAADAGATVTVTASASHVNGCILVAYGNVVGFDPTPAAGGAAGASSTSISAPSITPVNAGDTLVWCGATSQASATGAPSITIPGGYATEGVATTSSGPGSSSVYVTMAFGDKISGNASGATGAVAGTAGAAEVNEGATLISLQAKLTPVVSPSATPVGNIGSISQGILTPSIW